MRIRLCNPPIARHSLTLLLDDERSPLKVKRINLPKKPRRYFLPALVLCIILRLEIFHRVSLDLQCSKPGIEVSGGVSSGHLRGLGC